jgi:hypothetical protein
MLEMDGGRYPSDGVIHHRVKYHLPIFVIFATFDRIPKVFMVNHHWYSILIISKGDSRRAYQKTGIIQEFDGHFRHTVSFKNKCSARARKNNDKIMKTHTHSLDKSNIIRTFFTNFLQHESHLWHRNVVRGRNMNNDEIERGRVVVCYRPLRVSANCVRFVCWPRLRLQPPLLREYSIEPYYYYYYYRRSGSFIFR